MNKLINIEIVQDVESSLVFFEEEHHSLFVLCSELWSCVSECNYGLLLDTYYNKQEWSCEGTENAARVLGNVPHERLFKPTICGIPDVRCLCNRPKAQCRSYKAYTSIYYYLVYKSKEDLVNYNLEKYITVL